MIPCPQRRVNSSVRPHLFRSMFARRRLRGAASVATLCSFVHSFAGLRVRLFSGSRADVAQTCSVVAYMLARDRSFWRRPQLFGFVSPLSASSGCARVCGCVPVLARCQCSASSFVISACFASQRRAALRSGHRLWPNMSFKRTAGVGLAVRSRRRRPAAA